METYAAKVEAKLKEAGWVIEKNEQYWQFKDTDNSVIAQSRFRGELIDMALEMIGGL